MAGRFLCKARRLVVSSLYRYVGNPMYLAVLASSAWSGSGSRQWIQLRRPELLVRPGPGDGCATIRPGSRKEAVR